MDHCGCSCQLSDNLFFPPACCLYYFLLCDLSLVEGWGLTEWFPHVSHFSCSMISGLSILLFSFRARDVRNQKCTSSSTHRHEKIHWNDSRELSSKPPVRRRSWAHALLWDIGIPLGWWPSRTGQMSENIWGKQIGIGHIMRKESHAFRNWVVLVCPDCCWIIPSMFEVLSGVNMFRDHPRVGWNFSWVTRWNHLFMSRSPFLKGMILGVAEWLGLMVLKVSMRINVGFWGWRLEGTGDGWKMTWRWLNMTVSATDM